MSSSGRGRLLVGVLCLMCVLSKWSGGRGKIDIEGLNVISTPEPVLVNNISLEIDDLHCLAMQSSNIFHIPSSNLKTEIQKSVLAFGQSILQYNPIVFTLDSSIWTCRDERGVMKCSYAGDVWNFGSLVKIGGNVARVLAQRL